MQRSGPPPSVGLCSPLVSAPLWRCVPFVAHSRNIKLYSKPNKHTYNVGVSFVQWGVGRSDGAESPCCLAPWPIADASLRLVSLLVPRRSVRPPTMEWRTMTSGGFVRRCSILASMKRWDCRAADLVGSGTAGAAGLCVGPTHPSRGRTGCTPSHSPLHRTGTAPEVS